MADGKLSSTARNEVEISHPFIITLLVTLPYLHTFFTNMKCDVTSLLYWYNIQSSFQANRKSLLAMQYRKKITLFYGMKSIKHAFLLDTNYFLLRKNWKKSSQIPVVGTSHQSQTMKFPPSRGCMFTPHLVHFIFHGVISDN